MTELTDDIRRTVRGEQAGAFSVPRCMEWLGLYEQALTAAETALASERATREALRTQESRIMGVLADAGAPVGDVVAGVEWVVEALSNAHAALDAYEEIDRVVDDENGQPLTLSVAQRISALITLADGAANEANVLAEELASERTTREALDASGSPT